MNTMESDPDDYFHPAQEKVKWNKGEKPSRGRYIHLMNKKINDSFPWTEKKNIGDKLSL